MREVALTQRSLIFKVHSVDPELVIVPSLMFV